MENTCYDKTCYDNTCYFANMNDMRRSAGIIALDQ